MSATITVETRIPDDQIDALGEAIARHLAPLMARPQALTPQEASEMLGVVTKTLTKYERAGLLHPFRYDAIVRYDVREIAALLASGDHNASAENEVAA